MLVYEAPDTPTGFADVLNRVIADHSAIDRLDELGAVHPDLDPAEQSADDKALAAAVRVGISVFAASGDNGAYDCQANDLTDHRLSVDWPGASPDAISVGGTRPVSEPERHLRARRRAGRGSLSNQGGGGGLATGISRPSWQAGPGVQNSLLQRAAPGARRVGERRSRHRLGALLERPGRSSAVLQRRGGRRGRRDERGGAVLGGVA